MYICIYISVAIWAQAISWHKVSADAADGKDIEHIADMKEIEDEASVFTFS